MALPPKKIVTRPTSEEYVPDNSPKLFNSKTPALPRSVLQREGPSRRNELGAPSTPMGARDKDREIFVQRCPGFFPDLPGSPLQLGIKPHQADHYKTSNLSSPHDAIVSWSSQAPHTPGSNKPRPRYSAAVAPTRRKVIKILIVFYFSESCIKHSF